MLPAIAPLTGYHRHPFPRAGVDNQSDFKRQRLTILNESVQHRPQILPQVSFWTTSSWYLAVIFACKHRLLSLCSSGSWWHKTRLASTASATLSKNTKNFGGGSSPGHQSGGIKKKRSGYNLNACSMHLTNRLRFGWSLDLCTIFTIFGSRCIMSVSTCLGRVTDTNNMWRLEGST